MEESKSKEAFVNWWVVNKRRDLYELSRRTKDGSMQIVSAGSLEEALEIARTLGGENV